MITRVVLLNHRGVDGDGDVDVDGLLIVGRVGLGDGGYDWRTRAHRQVLIVIHRGLSLVLIGS